MELAAANVALICSAAVVERRWVERGWARESATVIRGGIDFGAINRWRGQDEARAELGLTADHHLVAMPHFSGDRRGLADALVAIASAHQFVPGIRLAVHGGLRNSPAMLAFASGLPDPEAFIGTEIVVERLISMADVVLLPGHHEASSTTQAWAMAAGAAVLAAATYATSELVADGHNGRLVKPGQAMVLARKLVEVFEQRDRTRQLNEVARGQAFQAFGLTRYVEQTRHAYENLLTARPIGQDMKDAAVDQ
jgi:glycosyltransferase involved in cell wall biosynthesis